MTSFMPIDTLEIKPRARFGHASVVYIMGADAEGPIKIGITSDIVNRVTSLQTGNPLPLEVFATRIVLPRFMPPGQDFSILKLLSTESARLEKAAHAKLQEMRLRLMGEWFDVTANEAIAVLDKVAVNISARAISKEWLLGECARIDPEIGFIRDDLLRRASAAEAQAVKANSVCLTAFNAYDNLPE